MKKVFAGIGMLVALFSIFFFLLLADKLAYFDKSTIYDFGLSKSISSHELKEIAEHTKVTVRLVDFKNISFGKKQIDVTLINPSPTFQLGRKDSVFPDDNIIYYELDEKQVKKIKYFTIQNSSDEQIYEIKGYLEQNGYNVEIDKEEPINFTVGMLFSPLNIGFFALTTILLVLSISTYYISRLKEIGILKLSGWSENEISFSLLLRMLSYIYLYGLVIVTPFSMYIIYSDVSKVFIFVQIYFLLCLFLFFFFLLSLFIGKFFISHINQVNAIKNNKNNKFIFYVLLIFKVIIAIFLVVSMKDLYNNIEKLISSNQAVNDFKKNEFFKIRTSIIPEQKIHAQIDKMVDSLNDEEVYNYSPENSMNIKKLKEYQKNNKVFNVEEASFISISANLLNVLPVVNTNGEVIKSSDLNQELVYLLVPIHYKKDINEIINSYGLEKNVNILFVKDYQIQNNLLLPTLYNYDSIYYIKKVQKTLYLNNGEVLLSKQGAKKMETLLNKLGLDKYSVTVESLNLDYNNFIANIQLDLSESVFYLAINSLSFILCIISLATIFLELRKKELAVYTLFGRYPRMAIIRFLIANGLITLTIILIVSPTFLCLLLIEGLIYMTIFYKYMKRKVILALKGE